MKTWLLSRLTIARWVILVAIGLVLVEMWRQGRVW